MFQKPPPSHPLLSVVVPVHGNLEATRACLASLERQETPFSFELVLVDSASGGETSSWLASLEGVRLVRLEENRGFPRAANAGAQAARGELILFLNNDTLLPSRALRRMVEAWKRTPRAGALGPSADRVKGDQRIQADPVEGDPLKAEALAARLEADYGGKVEDVPLVMGLALLLSAGLWKELGGFDERFGLGNFEDDDLCLRIREKGYRILVARDAFVHHAGMATFRAMGVDYAALVQRNQALFLEKWKDHPVLAARLLLDEGLYAEALAAGRKALLQGSRDPELFHILGTALYGENQPAEAVRAFDRLLQVAPRHTAGAFLRALALMDLGREKEARRAAASLLTDFYMADATAARLLSAFAEACLGWGRPAEAKDHFHTALLLDGANKEALTGLASIALEEGEREEARRLLEEAGPTPLALAMRGAMEWEEGNPGRALPFFREALHRDPFHPPSLSALFSLARGTEELARSLEELEEISPGETFGRAARMVREGALREAKDLLLSWKKKPYRVIPAGS